MHSVSGRWKRWRFSAGIIAPAALLLALTAIAVGGFVIWSAIGVDSRSLERQSALAGRALERRVQDIPRAQESIAIWDDAVQNAKLEMDPEWLASNLGSWMIEYYGFDAVAVVSDGDAIVYSSTADAALPFEAAWPQVASLVDDVRSQIASGALDDYAAETSPYPRGLDLKTIDGRPAIVSVMPITGDTDAFAQAPGSEYMHVAIEYLDANLAVQLEQDYRFESVSFTTGAAPENGRASRPIFDSNGRLIAFFDWEPSRPGVELLKQTGPVLGIGFIVALVLVISLIHRLWLSTSKLEHERVSAKYEAAHDNLTGLPNRAHFDALLARDLSDRRNRPQVALLMLDLDRFKQVNDTLGHEAGDQLIRAVGQRLAELIGPADILARLGGDEFAIIHLCRKDPESATDLGTAVIEAVSKPFDILGSEAFIGTSIGIAISGTQDIDARELTRKADIALYEAKGQGRNRLAVYEETMSALLQDRHLIEGELRDALKIRGPLWVAFQPLYDGQTGEISGAEALVRWTHPRLGQISPVRFVPIAEGTRLIEPLGEFVLREACMFGARWPGRRMAVNISPAQLRNPRFPERVFDLLVETAMRPSDLELEITEGILLDNDGHALEALTTFRNAGIRIALDDFGTGYSSLNYLKRYPVDCIKIDRSFVAQLAPDDPSTAIVQAMVTLAHALGIEVTAEGVETHEQMTILRQMGCNLFQGFLLSPPTTEEYVENKFRRASERRKSGFQQVA